MTEVSFTMGEEALEALARRAAELVREGMERDEGFMNVEEASTFLACGPNRLYALVSARRIPHHKDGSRLLFCRRELREYVRQGGAKRP
jgi:excisionase family DNA binding protein